MIFTEHILRQAAQGVNPLSPLLLQWAALPGEKGARYREQLERAAAVVPATQRERVLGPIQLGVDDEQVEAAMDVLVLAKKVLTSRFYPPAESWTGAEAWWINLPLTVVERAGDVHILCEQPGTTGFRYLCVPTAFVRQHLNGFSLIHDTHINLFLSAERKDEFTDRRGSGRLSFAQFER